MCTIGPDDSDGEAREGERARGAEVEEADAHPFSPPRSPFPSKVTPGIARCRKKKRKEKEQTEKRESTADAGSLPGAC